MKTKVKFFTVVCAILLNYGYSNAQGLYQNEKQEQASANEKSSLYDSSLRSGGGRPGGGGTEPGEDGEDAPVGDALWVLLLAGAAYGFKVYSDKRAATKE